MYLTLPLKGSHRNWVSAQGVKKASMMELRDGQKSFKIGLDTILAVTDSQPHCRSKYRAYYVAWVKIQMTENTR